jgi:hypothetical protein
VFLCKLQVTSRITCIRVSDHSCGFGQLRPFLFAPPFFFHPFAKNHHTQSAVRTVSTQNSYCIYKNAASLFLSQQVRSTLIGPYLYTHPLVPYPPSWTNHIHPFPGRSFFTFSLFLQNCVDAQAFFISLPVIYLQPSLLTTYVLSINESLYNYSSLPRRSLPDPSHKIQQHPSPTPTHQTSHILSTHTPQTYIIHFVLVS